MPKTTAIPPALNLSIVNEQAAKQNVSPGLLSPQSLHTPMSPRSTPGSPMLDQKEGRTVNGPVSPRITAVPEFPPSPDGSKHGREASRSFFANFKASKSSHKLQTVEQGAMEPQNNGDGVSRASSKERNMYSTRRQDSTPDLPRMTVNNAKASSELQSEETISAQPGSSDGSIGPQKKNKSKFGGILNRNRPGRLDDERRQRLPTNLSVDTSVSHGSSGDNDNAPLKTAPLKPDYRERTFGSETGSSNRARSVDRHGSNDNNASRKPPLGPSMMASSLPKESSSLFANISQTGKGVGLSLGKASKGLFNKMTRSGSSTEREMPTEENYICTTINLPLVKQTRKTRIAKRLEMSRDKTEFWMPALPWRCIDYLNMNGCEEEGLYRIPGSGREVKSWQKRFDIEYDIDLFEEPDLYDINTIGSMFKSWLRELPDEILPKSVQNRVSQECAGAQTPPKLLKDEISKLPPFNYYLLFAITCHLSLLHSFAEKNKMDFRNLCICFQPCLKIDAFCFSFLVLHWKECFQGCWTEHEYLQEEYRWEREGSTNSMTKDGSINERAISSSGSSQVVNTGNNNHHNHNHNHNHHQIPRSADAGIQKSGPLPQLPHIATNVRNITAGKPNGAGRGHTNSNSLPNVPKVTQQTPPQKSVPDSQLPELGNLSPIRM